MSETKERLTTCIHLLASSLSRGDGSLISALKSGSILSDTEIVHVQSQETGSQKAVCLVNYLISKPEQTVRMFQSMIKELGYKEIDQILQGREPVSEVASLKHEVERLTTRLNETKGLTSGGQPIDTPSGGYQEDDFTVREIYWLENRIQSQEEEANNLRQALEESQKNNDKLQDEINVLIEALEIKRRSSKEALADSLVQQKNENVDLKRENDYYLTKVQESEDKLQKLDAELTETKKSLDLEVTALQKIKEELDLPRTATEKEVIEKISQSRNMNKYQKDKLEEIEKNFVSKRKEVRSLKNQISSLDSQIKNLKLLHKQDQQNLRMSQAVKPYNRQEVVQATATYVKEHHTGTLPPLKLSVSEGSGPAQIPVKLDYRRPTRGMLDSESFCVLCKNTYLPSSTYDPVLGCQVHHKAKQGGRWSCCKRTSSGGCQSVPHLSLDIRGGKLILENKSKNLLFKLN